MTTNFRVNGVDTDDLLIRKDIFSEGGVWTWGSYGGFGFGTLGIALEATNISSPVQTLTSGNNWKQIVSGEQQFLGIKTDGTLWGWGYNNFGQLATNTNTNFSSAVQTISGGSNWKQVSGIFDTYGAIKTDGSLWMWGDGTFGNLGNNAITSRSSPVQTISGGFGWRQVAPGANHTSAIKTDNTLWMWGQNADGQLGNNLNGNSYSSPIQTVSGGTNWKQVSAGSDYTLAIKTDGTLWGWGLNGSGNLGNNNTTKRSSPVQTVAGGTNWKQVACGKEASQAGPNFAIKTDGTLWGWGGNNYGQLGDNTSVTKSSPVQTVAAGTNWKLVASSAWTVYAIKTDGTLWIWGYGFEGQLGNSTVSQQSSPIQTIAGGTNWKLVTGGYSSAGALRITD